ncbi:MAG: T9SS type A sorting domain-containing protein [Bacteroidia bacterium]|nr:T9SS type A sorting domain-containing protein [Bacteroidia bacterium]
MKKTTLILVSVVLFLSTKTSKAQSTLEIPCPVSIGYLQQNNMLFGPSPTVIATQSAFSASAIITCGNVRVFYEDMQQNLGYGFDDPVLGSVRRNTMCAMLNYVQSVFNFNGQTIDLHVNPSYQAPANPAPSGVTWAAVAGPLFVPGGFGTNPGYYGGNVYDHILTGTDPNANDYDAQMTVNFNLTAADYWDDYTNTTTPCKYDLYSILLHEFGHCMGFISCLGEGPGPNYYLINTIGNNSFTKLDQHFLWYGSPRNTATFNGNKLVTGTIASPNLHPFLSLVPNLLREMTNPAIQNAVWMTNQGAPNNSSKNYKAYDGNWHANLFGQAQPASFPGSFLSHLDKTQMSVYRAGQHAPGFQPEYVMNPVVVVNDKFREWTLQEIRMFTTLGYSLNPTFATLTNLATNNAVTNSALIFSNSPPSRTNTLSLVRYPITNQGEMWDAVFDPETKPADFVIPVNNNTNASPNITSLPIDTHTLNNLVDPDGQLIGIYPNSLYGIRGVSDGLNNHAQVVQTNSNTLVFTPTPGFYGRAEFGFNLWDGKEKGACKVITIDVTTNGAFVVPIGSELIINGGFEDATEVKTTSNPNAPMTARVNGYLKELNYGMQQSGGHPYVSANGAGDYYAYGIVRNESYRYCWNVTNLGNVPSLNPIGYGSELTSADGWNMNNWTFFKPRPVVTSNNNENYSALRSDWWFPHAPLVSTLYNPLQTCKYYRLEFDASQDIVKHPIGSIMSCSLLAINNLTSVPNTTSSVFPQLSYTVLQSIPIDYTVTATTTNYNNTNWQKVIVDFVYCGPPTSTIALYSLAQTNPTIYPTEFSLDNLSLKELTTPPPPLIVTATNSSTLFCPGGTFTLTGNAVNSSCSTSFTWQPWGTISPSVMVTPPTPTTTYTLFANDGCRTGSAVVTPAPLPVGTFTAGPVCIGHTSNFDLQSITPSSITLPAGYTGPALNWSVSSSTGGISTYIDLTAPNNTFAPGVYNYTLTQYLPAGCFQTYTFDVTFLGTPTVVATPSCILPGQSSTISAIPATWSYTWMPTSITSSSFVVTPTGSVTYDLRYDNGVCSAIIPKNAVVTVLTPVTFTNLPTTWCTNQTISHLNGFLAAGVPTTGQWFSAGPSPINSFINGLGYNFVISPTVAAGVYTINYIYSSTSNTNCNTFSSFTVNIIPNFTLSVSGPSLYCSNLALGAALSASATSTNVVSYGWMPGSLTGSSPTVFPTSATVYTVDAFDGTCSRSATLAVNVQTNCCSGNLNVVTGTVSSGNIGAIGLSTSINQNITITGSVNMVSEIRIASGVSITVANGATLTIFDKAGAHLYGCGDMWHGIIVNNTAQLNAVAGNVLIEDAVEAVSLANSNNITTNPANYNLRLNNVVFNRNLRGIVIRNSINNSPFDIRGCVFTCRNYTYNVTNWVNSFSLLSPVTPTNVMGSPYDMLGAPPIALKPPHNFLPMTNGILVVNSGIAGGINTPFPNFLRVIVGDQLGGGYQNLFDQLFVGINAVNSSVASYNNVFQNSSTLPGGAGAGIASVNTYTNQNNYTTSLDLVSPVSPSVYVNHFYDCGYGIFATNLYHFNMQYSEFQSTQATSIAITPTNAGYCGVYVSTNSYYDHNVSYNKFMNVYTGVYYGFVPAPLYVVSPPSYGMYWGNVKINNNLFCPNLSPVIFSPSSLYLHNAVILDNPMNSSLITAGLLSRSIEVNNNQMHRVHNGISATGFWKGTTVVQANNNYISLSPTTNSIRQFAIKKNYNVASSANTNTIISLTMQSYTNTTGIYGNYNINLSAQCNSVGIVNNSFDFEGWNQATKWRNNVMADSYNGLKLSINGEINTQGSNTNPSDNYWQNSTWWSMPNNCTFNENSQVLNSKLYLRNNNPTGGYYPTYNTSIPSGTTYTDVPGSALISSSPGPLFGCIAPFTGARMDSSDYGHLDTIAQNLAAYMVYQSETEEINRELLFENLVIDSTLRIGTPILNNFYTTNSLQELGLLNAIENNFSSGNLAYANTLLSSFTPTSNIQTNYKTFYQLYYNYSTQGFLLSKDSSTLDNLARKCPYIDGLSVYKARALNNILYKRMELYEDVFCMPFEELGSYHGEARKMRTNSSNVEGAKLLKQLNLRYQIFPNPAEDEVFITSNTQSETLHIVITDINSKVLLDEKIVLEGYVKGFKPNLINGLYFISLENDKGERLIKKLVISR